MGLQEAEVVTEFFVLVVKLKEYFELLENILIETIPMFTNFSCVRQH